MRQDSDSLEFTVFLLLVKRLTVEVFNKLFSTWLYIARKTSGVTQAELAKRAGVSRHAISNYETGKFKTVLKLDTLKKILSALDPNVTVTSFCEMFEKNLCS
ncbi:MAG: helix-turn-helix transcriptional regulator [Selenomonadaceae bacterium]|nr:helix-turn-helix transcriptional regulator [Selenomonadaceae bacterium]